MPRALLIDDEASARQDLRNKLAAHPEIEIVGEAATVRTARELLKNAEYDLAFLDVQIIGGESFELVPDVRPGARVIFATAHDRYALRAFEINALDYLLKPVDPVRLAAGLRRLAANPVQPDADDPPAAAPSGAALTPDDTIYLRSGLRARFAAVQDISLISASDNYTEVVLADSTKVFLRKSLKAWEDSLPASLFMRVHRTQLVNLDRVTRYQRDGDEHTLLYVEGTAEPVTVSRYRWSDLKARLSAIRPEP